MGGLTPPTFHSNALSPELHLYIFVHLTGLEPATIRLHANSSNQLRLTSKANKLDNYILNKRLLYRRLFIQQNYPHCYNICKCSLHRLQPL